MDIHLKDVFSYFQEKSSNIHDDDSFIKLLNEIWNDHCNHMVRFLLS